MVGLTSGGAGVPRSAAAVTRGCVAALLVYAPALAARGWRWHRIMGSPRSRTERADAYCLTLVGYMGNNVLPARGGEVLRIGAARRPHDARKRRRSSARSSRERVLDVAVLAALFALLTWTGVAGAPAGQWPRRRGRSGARARGGIGLATYLALRRRGRFERFDEKVAPGHARR